MNINRIAMLAEEMRDLASNNVVIYRADSLTGTAIENSEEDPELAELAKRVSMFSKYILNDIIAYKNRIGPKDENRR